MIRYPQVVSALFTALPKRRQGGAELRFGPRGSSRHSFAPLFKTSQLYHFSLHPVSSKAFRSADILTHENHGIFESLPRAGKRLAPRLLAERELDGGREAYAQGVQACVATV